MTPEERKKYRAIGGRLAVFIRNGSARSTTTTALQAVVADLVGDRTELLLPLKDLVGRPGFRLLIPKAGSGSGSLERLALLQELERTFAPAITVALEELLAGFLDLPGGRSNPGKKQEKPKAGAPSGVDRAPEQAVPREAATSTSKQPDEDPEKAKASVRRSPMWAAGWLVAAAASGALVLGGLIALRPPWACSALGLCQRLQTNVTEETLRAATQAVQDLEGATDLDSYRNAAEALEQELLKLSGDQLTASQKIEVERLELMRQKARSGLLEEQQARTRLQQASAAIDSAARLTGEDQQQLIEEAREALNAIPERSFASREVRQLQETLELIGVRGTPRNESPAGPFELAPQRSTRPNPRPSQPKSPPSDGSIWREEPLF